MKTQTITSHGVTFAANLCPTCPGHSLIMAKHFPAHMKAHQDGVMLRELINDQAMKPKHRRHVRHFGPTKSRGLIETDVNIHMRPPMAGAGRKRNKPNWHHTEKHVDIPQGSSGRQEHRTRQGA